MTFDFAWRSTRSHSQLNSSLKRSNPHKFWNGWKQEIISMRLNLFRWCYRRLYESNTILLLGTHHHNWNNLVSKLRDERTWHLIWNAILMVFAFCLCQFTRQMFMKSERKTTLWVADIESATKYSQHRLWERERKRTQLTA